MYFSQFEINATKVHNPYEIHQQLWNAFRLTGDQERSFLFRVNWQKNSRAIPILVQSKSEPQQPQNENCLLRAKKSIHLDLKEGQILRFALCANPIKRLSNDKNRVPLFGDAFQIEWLKHKLEPVTHLLEAQVVNSRTLYFQKKQAGGTINRGKLVTVMFDGMLQVKEPEQLVQLIETGIGPAKAFGCGLLTLAKP